MLNLRVETVIGFYLVFVNWGPAKGTFLLYFVQLTCTGLTKMVAAVEHARRVHDLHADCAVRVNLLSLILFVIQFLIASFIRF